tara:strand:- start:234 stop:521 length:288 start_codon:yes stop_codon:yes gene_type:complete
MSRTVQLHISQNEIEKYMMSENELTTGLTVDATLDEDNVLLDVWCVDTSTNEEVNIKSNRLNIGPNGAQTAFMWCIFLGLLAYLTNMLLYSQTWY